MLHIETLPKLKPGARLIIVGDIHGCVNEFNLLLDKAKYNPEKGDTILLLGDLVNKGYDSVGVVRRAIQLRARCILGNHDVALLNHIAAPDMGNENDPLWQLAQGFPSDCIAYLKSLPYAYRIPQFNLIVVHAGMNPKYTLEEQNVWELLHMRSIDEKTGQCWEDLKGTLWASAWKGPEHVIFGHDARSGLQQHEFATGIDTACCYGKHLTGMIYPGAEFVQVRSKFFQPREARAAAATAKNGGGSKATAAVINNTTPPAAQFTSPTLTSSSLPPPAPQTQQQQQHQQQEDFQGINVADLLSGQKRVTSNSTPKNNTAPAASSSQQQQQQQQQNSSSSTSSFNLQEFANKLNSNNTSTNPTPASASNENDSVMRFFSNGTPSSSQQQQQPAQSSSLSNANILTLPQPKTKRQSENATPTPVGLNNTTTNHQASSATPTKADKKNNNKKASSSSAINDNDDDGDEVVMNNTTPSKKDKFKEAKEKRKKEREAAKEAKAKNAAAAANNNDNTTDKKLIKLQTTSPAQQNKTPTCSRALAVRELCTAGLPRPMFESIVMQILDPNGDGDNVFDAVVNDSSIREAVWFDIGCGLMAKLDDGTRGDQMLMMAQDIFEAKPGIAKQVAAASSGQILVYLNEIATRVSKKELPKSGLTTGSIKDTILCLK